MSDKYDGSAHRQMSYTKKCRHSTTCTAAIQTFSLYMRSKSGTYKHMATSLTARLWLLETSSALKSSLLKLYIWAASVPTKNCRPSPLRAMEVTALSSCTSLSKENREQEMFQPSISCATLQRFTTYIYVL